MVRPPGRTVPPGPLPGQCCDTYSWGTPPNAAPAGSTAAGKTAKCRTADLTVTAGDRTITGDADNTVVVELKNHGGKDCALCGYAGVDLKTSADTLSAERSGEPVRFGCREKRQVDVLRHQLPGQCLGRLGVKVTGLVVTPPDETQSVTLAWWGRASATSDRADLCRGSASVSDGQR